MAICDDEDELKKSFADLAKQVAEAKIPIITKDYITDCINEANKLSTKKYQVVSFLRDHLLKST